MSVTDGRRRIVDAHVHLFDHAANRHAFLERRDATFAALVGDYAALPRRWSLLQPCLHDGAFPRLADIDQHDYLHARCR